MMHRGFFGFLYGKGLLRGPAMESLGTGAGRGKASSCPFLPIPAPLRPVPSDSIAGPLKKRGEKFGN